MNCGRKGDAKRTEPLYISFVDDEDTSDQGGDTDDKNFVDEGGETDLEDGNMSDEVEFVSDEDSEEDEEYDKDDEDEE
ncbi:MAG: hypothetical protein ALECFALPRED_004311 [Alectoria fallacina]|uniref:Uncharacterized protein n=1 Tax=Alectoria fallacina TaxID=1903189 RepID=A0A8H3FQP2_9LECA|nr:MAG: hypothetical protein ALECFALPRED_004311 [Alectoria fallacina]